MRLRHCEKGLWVDSTKSEARSSKNVFNFGVEKKERKGYYEINII